ncbi:MAG TPA: alpha-L-arabinofuranosidase C-terminal domain-containing protein, partial [Chloroflexota bacterium]|nr:alpha-L-arabinofuranosidase C-terminal domain-containing protein [Chloroflexota bacterium]
HDSTYYGVVVGWNPIGTAPLRVHRYAYKGDQGVHRDDTITFSHDNTHYYVPGDYGRGQSQRIDVRRATGRPCGLGQAGLGLRAGQRYTGYVLLRGEGITEVEISLADETLEIAGIDAEWRRFPFTFAPDRAYDDARFSITTRRQGTLWIGAVSLMPEDQEAGWRHDVNALIRALRPPIIRYPGGNFAASYHWRDGVGERDRRPVRLDRVWNVYEPNDVGTDEFMTLCHLLDATPYLCVNMGDGTPREAAAWVEYCNGPDTSEYGALRAANGHPEPYNVIYWGLGNEVYGNWQIGHVDAERYARDCVTWAQAMRAADPQGERLKLLAVGATPDFWPEWNEAVARIAGEQIDYITLHHYAQAEEAMPRDDEYLMTVTAPARIAELIADSRAAIDANAPAGKRIPIAFDEWNVIHQTISDRRPVFNADWPALERQTLFTGIAAQLDTVAQLRVKRQQYALVDGLYAAGVFNVFLRNADQVTMANQAQLVNLLGLIETEQTGAYPTAEYWAFRLYVEHSGPVAVPVSVDVPTFDMRAMSTMPARHGVPYLDVAATRDREGRRLWLHVVNRHPHAPIAARIDLNGGIAGAVMHVLQGQGPWSRNAFGDDTVVTVRSSAVEWDGAAPISFPACSATSLEITLV